MCRRSTIRHSTTSNYILEIGLVIYIYDKVGFVEWNDEDYIGVFQHRLNASLKTYKTDNKICLSCVWEMLVNFAKQTNLKKKISCMQDPTFWPKRNTAMNYKYSCYTRNRWFSWVVTDDMTSNIHFKKKSKSYPYRLWFSFLK